MPPENLPSALVHDGVHRVDVFDIPGWDDWLATQSRATIFHSAAWARVLQNSYGYQPIFFVRSLAGRIRAVLPVMEVDSWLTGRRGVALPFTDYVSPLYDDANCFRELFDAALAHGRERKWKYWECRCNGEPLASLPSSVSFWGHRLELQADTAGLLSGLDESVRRSVRKSERSALAVEFSREPDAIRAFYDLLCLTRKRHGLPPQPFSFFAQIQTQVLAKKSGWVVLARQGDTPVAGAVYFHFGRTALYKYGASNAAFQHLRPNNLVMWQAIQRYAADGFSVLDFGRTSVDNEGLRRFKLGWGASEQLLGYVRYDYRQNQFTNVPDQASGLHTRVFAKIPMGLARMAGALLYRHWG